MGEFSIFFTNNTTHHIPFETTSENLDDVSCTCRGKLYQWTEENNEQFK